jgi:PAS domain S-box-containing protein
MLSKPVKKAGGDDISLFSDKPLTAIYRNRTEMADLLTNYFGSALGNNELCTFFTTGSIDHDELRAIFSERGMDIQPYIQSSQFELINIGPSIFNDPEFLSENMKDILGCKQEHAVANGFSGCRINIDLCDVGGQVFSCINNCRECIESLVCGNDANVMCSCPMDAFSAHEIFEMMDRRESFILKTDDRWVFLKDLLSNKYRKHLRYTPEMMRQIGEERSVYRNSPVVAIMWEDKELHPVKQVSENISIFGYSMDDFSSEKLHYKDIIHPEDRKGYFAGLQECIKNGHKEFNREYRIIGSTGQVHWVNERSMIGHGHNGIKYRDQGIIVDITDKRIAEEALQRSEQKFKMIFDNSNDSILMIDYEGHFLEVNHVAHEQLGYMRSEMLQMRVHDICSSEQSVVLGEMRTRVLSEEHSIFEAEFVRKDGTLLPVEINASVLEYDGNDVILVIARDITERKKAEMMLVEAKYDAEAANRSKSEFVANMSHELRTPLNAVIGFSDVMLEGACGALEERQEKYIRNISTAGNHLLDMINDILDLSKVEAGKMILHPEEFPVRDALDEVIMLLNQLASKKDLELITDVKPCNIQINADKSKIKQILYNLISNAIKFTPERGSIMIKVRSWTDSVVFFVKDSGIGISKVNQGKLFQPFSQIDSASTRRYAGTGLGLVLTKRFVEMHGGEIWVDSEEGAGSTFGFNIQMSGPVSGIEDEGQDDCKITDNNLTSGQDLIGQDAIGDAEIMASDNSTEDAPLMLVVDNDVKCSELLTLTLTTAGYRVICAYNGYDALDLARTLRPFAITLGIVLPDMDGWETLEHLKFDAVTCNIPVIMVSVLDEVKRSAELGAIAHLTKPVDKVRLFEILSEYERSSDRRGMISLSRCEMSH